MAFQASPALLPTPDVHQNAFLRAVADYTYACFTPVIVSPSSVLREVCAYAYVANWLTCAWGGQAIYPMLIIVIVALNWSPIEHGLSGSAGTVYEQGRPPTRLDLDRAATTSTVVVGDTIQMRCVRNEENGDVDAETKRGAVVV